MGQMNNLVHGMATAAGRVMSLATVVSRHMWQSVKTPLDAFHCLGESIMAEHAHPRERGAFKVLSREPAFSVLTPHGQTFPSRGVLRRDVSPESTTALSLGPHS